ncbi:hypothetical protein [Modestobacter sp. VKM Ac-2984]|uniref:hypothetical protein n=1 Tax=Modestobacter sp. VKM Ac-2984 TaxID=3004138 RepID=UPI0022AB36BB|nr:hypothetical protein [Modestobacter sp. VKM Ac-2984]MCZ2814917.1 hypothetical protein [Modestobacter sp. VKM Ac-2984]
MKPYGETSSSRWFWVRELEGAPHPDTEAYVWSDLVVNQTETPRCTDEESRYYVRITPPVLGLGQGALAPGGGYRYLVTLNNMGADRDVTITCYDTVSPNGFYTFTMHTDASGYASAGDQCFSGDYGQHWVTADEGLVTSNTVTW